MYIKLSKNSFVRIDDDGQLGYITNQLTRHDRTYDETGADFLAQITRIPQDISCIVDRLTNIFDADRGVIESDFLEFSRDLYDHKFVLLGEDPESLDDEDLTFSYMMENPKTLAEDFVQDTKQSVENCTQDFLLEHDKARPRLASLEFEITSRCNERCIHCYIPNAKKNAGFDLTFDRFKYILDQFAAMGGIHVTISGGEALLNKDVMKMLSYSRERDMMI